MKKIIGYVLFISLPFLFTTVDAQTSVGFRGGISIPNLTSGGADVNPLNTGYSSRLGPDAAIFAEFKLSKLFSIQPMIEYSAQGGKKDGLQAFPTPVELIPMLPPPVPPYLYANFKSEAKFNYLMIPILAKVGWNFGAHDAFRFYVDAGPFVGFLLSAKQVTTGSSQIYIDPDGQVALPGGEQPFNNEDDIKDQLHTTNVGIEGNLGLSFSFAKVSSIFIEGGGNYGFLNIQKGSENGKNNIGAATVTIGYAYQFGK